MVNSREEVTQKIIAEKVRRGIRWNEVAERLGPGYSKEWTTAACLGQMKMSKEEAEKVAGFFGLDSEECAWLQISPYKSSKQSGPPADPLLYRFYEALGVYGPTMKELIHEEFGDGIMSAVDFRINVDREKDEAKGDRVRIVWSGKFLPYNKF